MPHGRVILYSAWRKVISELSVALLIAAVTNCSAVSRSNVGVSNLHDFNSQLHKQNILLLKQFNHN